MKRVEADRFMKRVGVDRFTKRVGVDRSMKTVAVDRFRHIVEPLPKIAWKYLTGDINLNILKLEL